MTHVEMHRDRSVPKLERPQKPTERDRDDRRPLWEKPHEQAQEFWMNVEEVLGRTGSEIVDTAPDGTMVVGHGRGDTTRARLVGAERLQGEGKAEVLLDGLEDRYADIVNALLKTAGEASDFSREELMAMQSELLVESANQRDPVAALTESLRALTRADRRERSASLLERQGQLRQVELEFHEETDPRTRQLLTNTIQALQREIFKIRRELHPEAAKKDLLDMVDDIGGLIEPQNERPDEETSLSKTQERIEDIEGQMAKINRKGDFNPLDELKWYALKTELAAQQLMARAQDVRDRHPQLYKTDFANKREGMRWDQKLFSIGREISHAERKPIAPAARESSVYRLLRDVYVDVRNQGKAVDVVDSILKSSTAPERLKEAAKAIKEDVREGMLPKPKVLAERRRQREQLARKDLQDNAAEAQAKREAMRKSPLEQVFEIGGTQYPVEHAGAIAKELGVSEGDLVGARKTFDLVRARGKRSGVGSEWESRWSAFIKAPVQEPGAKKGLFGRLKDRVRAPFSPRRKMIREMKGVFNRLPPQERRLVVMDLDRKKANVFGLKE